MNAPTELEGFILGSEEPHHVRRYDLRWHVTGPCTLREEAKPVPGGQARNQEKLSGVLHVVVVVRFVVLGVAGSNGR